MRRSRIQQTRVAFMNSLCFLIFFGAFAYWLGSEIKDALDRNSKPFVHAKQIVTGALAGDYK